MKVLKVSSSNTSVEKELKVWLEVGDESKFLVPVEEFFKEQGQYCLIMELCKGDLESLLKSVITLPETVCFCFLI
jgi:hypothetical protein